MILDDVVVSCFQSFTPCSQQDGLRQDEMNTIEMLEMIDMQPTWTDIIGTKKMGKQLHKRLESWGQGQQIKPFYQKMQSMFEGNMVSNVKARKGHQEQQNINLFYMQAYDAADACNLYVKSITISFRFLTLCHIGSI